MSAPPIFGPSLCREELALIEKGLKLLSKRQATQKQATCIGLITKVQGMRRRARKKRGTA